MNPGKMSNIVFIGGSVKAVVADYVLTNADTLSSMPPTLVEEKGMTE